MTINLLQVDESGQERMTSMFQSPEDRATMEWLMSLEVAASGTTIFVHRLSDPGHYLCTIPCPYSQLTKLPGSPPRYCGCFTCIDTRKFLNDYTARVVIVNMLDLIPPHLAAEFSQGDKNVVEWC